ncbi:MAG: cupin domain-containing protein [Jatrophihabitantaceae bacterium]
MPRTSKASIKSVDHGLVEDSSTELDGYTVNFVTFKQACDMTPLLKGLPGDSCQCPHWGVLVKGRITIRYDNREEEVVEAGDVFYMSPGHVPVFENGSEIIQFSPAADLARTDEAIMRNMQALQGA